MIGMTENDAEHFVRSLAPATSAASVAWGTRMMLTVARACGGQSNVDLKRAWVKALEVSTQPYAAVLLDAVSAVPPKPEPLPAGWETAVQPV